MTKIDNILKKIVNEKRESAKLVGFGAIVVQHGKVVGLAVSGERKKGSGASISPNDLWHIGSITKSFTATMIARLVEKGELNWDTTIKDSFPEASNIHAQWNDVTLKHLLTHTSGAASNPSLLNAFKNPDAGISRMVARESAAKDILINPPKSIPGSAFLYSNVGYTIAGVIAEKKMGIPWEQLIHQEVFTPIGIHSGGFGAPPDIEGELSQPWGHKKILGFTISTKADNTPIIGPAGTIHLSLTDLALYANEHLQGLQGRGSALKTDTFQHLHQPHLNDYAYGWLINSPLDLGLDNVHWHNGSNTAWYALVVLLPDINAAIAITANDGNVIAAEKVAWEITQHLVEPLKASYSRDGTPRPTDVKEDDILPRPL